MKRALVIGHRGQDGTLLSQHLVTQGYEVAGLGQTEYKRGSMTVPGAVPRLGSTEDMGRVVRELVPDEIYYLAAYHRSSEEREAADPLAEYLSSYETHVLGLVNVLESMRRHAPRARLFYASSSLVFAGAEVARQTESTPLVPQGVYGMTKVAGMLLCREYRQRHGVFASAGILYNHESHLRSPAFVSRKIIDGAIAIRRGRQASLEIGNLAAVVDWSHAADFVRAFHAMLQQPEPDDFIVASGTRHTIEDFVREAFAVVGLDWRDKVRVRPDSIFRPFTIRIGDPAKLRNQTDWAPRLGFSEMIRDIVVALDQVQ